MCVKLLIIGIFVQSVLADKAVENSFHAESSPEELLLSKESSDHSDEEMIKAMEQIEESARLARKQLLDGVLPLDETEDIYHKMADELDDIIDLMYDPNNAYTFLNKRGLERIVSPNIAINFPKLRNRFLILLKALFDIAPTTTKSIIPYNILDRLVDIFENDSNLGTKAHSLDILSVWLPNNPEGQARVMERKGLEPFYRQLPKLDTSVIYVILDLFNKILEEHLEMRGKQEQKNKDDYDTFKLYRRIGLLEHISTPTVCDGLLNIFVDVWSFYTEGKNAILPVLKLVKNIRPFCLEVYIRNSKAIALLDELSKFVADPNRGEYFNKLQVNVTDISDVLKEFSEKVRSPQRDEL